VRSQANDEDAFDDAQAFGWLLAWDRVTVLLRVYCRQFIKASDSTPSRSRPLGRAMKRKNTQLGLMMMLWKR
jgi:hypothetical protein